MSETVEVDPVGAKRHAPVKLIGRLIRGAYGRLEIELAPSPVPYAIKEGTQLLVRAWPGGPWRTGRCEVDEIGQYNLANIVACCEGDYVYRIGKPLTPSLEERVEAMERLLGLVVDDLEVASDAEASGHADAAVRLRAAAVARIRESVQMTPSRGTLPP